MYTLQRMSADEGEYLFLPFFLWWGDCLSIIHSKPIHFMISSFLELSNISFYVYARFSLIHSPVAECLGWFPFLAVISRTATDMDMNFFLR